VRFFQYEATEQQLVDHVVMNLHPSILEKAAFLDRPRLLRELYRMIGLMEEKMSLSKERERVEEERRAENGDRIASR